MTLFLVVCHDRGLLFQSNRRELSLKSYFMSSYFLEKDLCKMLLPCAVITATAAAAHPQCAASLSLSARGCVLFLTSDPGIEGDAHTAVGVVGLHGNFPCTPGTVTERQGGRRC